MKNFLKNYKSSITLISFIIIGGVIGTFSDDKIILVKPIGDLFLNLLFMTLVPLIFFCTSSALASMNKISRMGKILKNSIIVFLFTAFISISLGILGIFSFKNLLMLDPVNFNNLSEEFTNSNLISLKELLKKSANIFTSSDFSLLLSKNNIFPLIVFSILFGISTSLCKEKGKPIAAFLNSGKDIMLKLIELVMKLAPFCLACYFANVVHETGPQIFSGYAKIFILYLLITVFSFFVLFTFYAYISGGITAIKIFWKNIIPPSIMALGSCSSSASLPANLIATKKMGVPDDIAEIVLPLGINVHKDGSLIGNVFKIFFLHQLIGQNFFDFSTIFIVFIVAFITSVIIGAIPSGGVAGEMALLSILGFSPELLPLILIISTIIDAPATLLNSTGNTVCAMMVTKLTDRKLNLKEN